MMTPDEYIRKSGFDKIEPAIKKKTLDGKIILEFLPSDIPWKMSEKCGTVEVDRLEYQDGALSHFKIAYSRVRDQGRFQKAVSVTNGSEIIILIAFDGKRSAKGRVLERELEFRKLHCNESYQVKMADWRIQVKVPVNKAGVHKELIFAVTQDLPEAGNTSYLFLIMKSEVQIYSLKTAQMVTSIVIRLDFDFISCRGRSFALSSKKREQVLIYTISCSKVNKLEQVKNLVDVTWYDSLENNAFSKPDD